MDMPRGRRHRRVLDRRPGEKGRGDEASFELHLRGGRPDSTLVEEDVLDTGGLLVRRESDPGGTDSGVTTMSHARTRQPATTELLN